MRRVVVIGSAATLDRDLVTLAFSIGGVPPDDTVSVNDAGMWFPTMHWASLHPELFHRDRGGPGWLRRRAFPNPGTTLYGPTAKPTMGVVPVDTLGRGSSGFFGVEVALDVLRADRVILVGIPMTPTPHRRRDTGPWDAANAHFAHWRAPGNAERFRNVRSVSGRTMDLLGHPDPAWWAGDDHTSET